MEPERQMRMRGHLGRGTLVSLLLHFGVLFPLGVMTTILAGRDAAERDVEMTFEEVSPSQLPDDLPPIEQLPAEKPPTEAEKKKQEARALAQPKPVAQPEIEVPPPDQLPKIPDEQPPEPKPRPSDKLHEKVVDLDMGKEVEPPPEAKFLAQKNNRADKETRATDTNLEREQKGDKGSSPSDRKDEQTGDDKQKIAELEDQKSKLGRRAPEVTPHENPELQKAEPQPQPSRKSLLAMRETPPRMHEITPETATPSLPRDPDRARELPMDGLQAVRALPAQPGQADKVRLRLTGQELDYLFGADADAARRLAEKEKSKRPGRFSGRLGRVQSALENFIPEVQPGNQTALNTRAAPFAAFIARMHRNIHKLWGFGFLEDLESKSGSSPYNDPNLMSKLEIVLKGDGTIDNVKVIRVSGYTPFDVAAVDVAWSAGPYPDPPREIRSKNGKIYIHWSFHRDERQCATSGVDYFILENAAPGADQSGGETANQTPVAPRPTEPAFLGPPRAPGPKRLTREFDDPKHRAKMRELDEAAGGAAPAQSARKQAAAMPSDPDDPAARSLAEHWFDAYARGDVAAMTKLAAFPFHSSAGVAAKSATELQGMLKSLIDETPGKRTARALQVYSPAGARGVLGGLPPGLDDPRALFAVTHAGGDTFVLILMPQNAGWRAAGLVRR